MIHPSEPTLAKPSRSPRTLPVEAPGAAKRAAERWYLIYTPVWGVVSGAVMVSGITDRMGEGGFLLLGFGLWAGLVLPPVLRRAPALCGVRAYHLKFQVWIGTFAFFGSWWTSYFAEMLHLRYGFPTEVTLNGVPLFLYPLTACYFTTYAVLMNMGIRLARRWLGDRPKWVQTAAVVPVCWAVAALETALNANPFIDDLFCYEDMALMLWFGTAVYGLWFVIASPFWFRIDEDPDRPTPWSEVLLSVLAAWALVQMAMEVVQHWIAPHITDVARGVQFLRPGAESCLAS